METNDKKRISEEEMKKYSKNHPTKVFKSEEGKFILDGEIYNSKKDLERNIQMQQKMFKFFSNNRLFRFIFGIKKRDLEK